MQQTPDSSLTITANEISRDFPSRAEVLVDVRRMVEDAASQTSLDRGAIDDLLTAVDEAAANAIRHGSPVAGSDARLRVICFRSPDSLGVKIRDFGKGFAVPQTPTMPSPDAMGGRGLPLMVALADSVAIASTLKGTTVTLIKGKLPG